LIENGVLKSYLHNTSTSKNLNQKPTGNAGIVYPMPWKIEIKKGDYNFDEMVKELKGRIDCNKYMVYKIH